MLIYALGIHRFVMAVVFHQVDLRITATLALPTSFLSPIFAVASKNRFAATSPARGTTTRVDDLQEYTSVEICMMYSVLLVRGNRAFRH